MKHLSREQYGDLPRFAGICSPSEAMRPGLSVEECVRRLKRYHYAFKRLNQILISRLTAEPVYEFKILFSYHAYLCAEHVAALRKRVAELREPPRQEPADFDPFWRRTIERFIRTTIMGVERVFNH